MQNTRYYVTGHTPEEAICNGRPSIGQSITPTGVKTSIYKESRNE